ncbi:MAG: ATP-binding cassette domain-containing protein [Coriobacteriales bacterium]|jgi:energy-coupling factor transport system ATP-binding protein|nr:ATP-binding cassette domain-containing protein [Coriobacteriales bacterium]
MLSFEQVTYYYPGAADPALAGVTLSVAPGEHVVLLGSNGSGKSTLARLANGLLLPAEGNVCVNGQLTSDRTVLRALRSQVGVIAQDPDNQIVSASVLDEVAFGPENLGLERELIIERVTRALEALGLIGFEQRDPNTLSGGEKQRLVIAGILAMDPIYLVLDEPTSMLDRLGRREVRDAIGSLHARGHGILHITHDLSFARDADRVFVLREGRLVFAGLPATLLNDEGLLVACGLKVPNTAQAPGVLPPGGRLLVSQPPVVSPPAVSPPVTQQAAQTLNDPLVQTLHPVTAPKDWKERGGSFPSLHLDNVHFSYGVNTDAEREVLRGVSLNITPGSYTLISGNSGSGKSTLLRILSGLLEPSLGTAAFSNGSRLFPSAVGIVFQHPETQLFAQTVEDEIAFGPANLGLLPTKEVRGNVVREALDAVGLDPRIFFHRSPFSLSGGEMRRVAIASILAMRPTFLLLDEPTAGLDAAGRAFVHALIERLTRATTGVVVVSHDVEEFTPRVQAHLELRGGRLWHR